MPGKRSASRKCKTNIWLVNFTDHDLAYFDLETRVFEPLENPFGPKNFVSESRISLDEESKLGSGEKLRV